MSDKKVVIVDLKELKDKIDKSNLEVTAEININNSLYIQEQLSFSRLLFAISSGTLSFLMINFSDNKEMLLDWKFRSVIAGFLVGSILGIALQFYNYEKRFEELKISYKKNNPLLKSMMTILQTIEKPLHKPTIEDRILYYQQIVLLLSFFILILYLFFPSCR